MRYTAILLMTILLTSLYPTVSLAEVESEISSLKEQLTADPSNLNLRQQLGRHYYNSRRYEECIDILKSGIEEQTPEVQLLLARAYNRNKDGLNEFRVLKLLVTSNPKNYLAQTQLGYYYLGQRRTKENRDGVLSSFKAALNANKKFLPAYDGLIKYFTEANDNYQLRMLYQDMIEIFGRKANYISQLCKLNSNTGYLDQAKTFCSEGIRLDPENAENHIYLGLALINQQELNQAEKILKKATDSFPNSAAAHFAYAEFLTSQNNYLKAEKHYLLATKADPKHAKAAFALAKNLSDQKKYLEALPAFGSACKLDVKNSSTLLKKIATQLRLENQQDLEEKYTVQMNRCL